MHHPAYARFARMSKRTFWELELGANDEWVPYDPRSAELLEAARQRGDLTVRLKLAGRPYTRSCIAGSGTGVSAGVSQRVRLPSTYPDNLRRNVRYSSGSKKHRFPSVQPPPGPP